MEQEIKITAGNKDRIPQDQFSQEGEKNLNDFSESLNNASSLNVFSNFSEWLLL